jgi:arylsulfatase A-like enzyme
MLGSKVDDFPENFFTFPEILRSAGYETVNFGRYNCIRPNLFERMERTGDFLPEVTNHFGLNEKYDEEEFHVIKRPGSDKRPLIIAGTYPGESNPNLISTDRAVEFLSSRPGGKHSGTTGATDADSTNNTPFLLRIAYNQPHTPTLAPPPFDTLYNPDDLPVRYFDRDAYRTRSEFDRRIADLHRMDLLSDKQIRQVWKDYMGLCAYIDMQIGRVLDALEKADLSEETIIMYSTDHGKSLGEWGSGEKGTFDSEVWRVPFIWSYPSTIPRGVEEAPCGTIDTARTLLSLIGLERDIPDSWRGRNLFSAGSPNEGADVTVDPQLGRLSFGSLRHAIDDWPDLDGRLFRVAVRSIRYRFDVNWFGDGSRPPDSELDGTLFDLESDSGETRNRFSDNAMHSVRASFIAAIERWIDHCPTGEIMKNPANAGVYF